MSGITGGTGYVNCLDPAMGMTVNGSADNVKDFHFICLFFDAFRNFINLD